MPDDRSAATCIRFFRGDSGRSEATSSIRSAVDNICDTSLLLPARLTRLANGKMATALTNMDEFVVTPL